MNFQISNLLQTHPSTAFIYANEAFAGLIFLFIVSFAFEYFRRKCINESYKRVLRGVPSTMRWVSFIMLIMTWTRIVGIPYISMRVWWFMLVLFIVYYLVRLWRNYRVFESKKHFFGSKVQTQDNLKKYLPTKKKKK